jgi:hypothetical protein
MFIPDPDRDFFPIPVPGFKKAPDPGSGSATLRDTFFTLQTINFLFAVVFFGRVFLPSIS